MSAQLRSWVERTGVRLVGDTPETQGGDVGRVVVVENGGGYLAAGEIRDTNADTL